MKNFNIVFTGSVTIDTGVRKKQKTQKYLESEKFPNKIKCLRNLL